MVYYFKSSGVSGDVDPPVILYMGKDKEENEDLIKYGRDTDVWFHVDKLSSAHVYLRLQDGWSWDSIPQEILQDCAQLTKANSIQGNKMDNITIIYTPWRNLKKTGDMAVGQVGFKKEKEVRRVHVDTRVNAIINRLNKTREELYPDLQKDKQDYESELQSQEAELRRQRQKEELALARERKQLRHQKDHAYDDLFTDENVRHSNNQFRPDDYEDDFW